MNEGRGKGAKDEEKQEIIPLEFQLAFPPVMRVLRGYLFQVLILLSHWPEIIFRKLF
jgi:hypothetical protein